MREYTDEQRKDGGGPFPGAHRLVMRTRKLLSTGSEQGPSHPFLHFLSDAGSYGSLASGVDATRSRICLAATAAQL